MQEETDGDPRCASLPGPGGRRAPGAGRESGDTERCQSARLKLCVSWPRPPCPGSLTCAGPAALAVRQWPRNPQGSGCRISLLVQRHQRRLWHLLAPPWHAIGPVPAVGPRQPCDGATACAGVRGLTGLTWPPAWLTWADLGAAGLTLDPVGPVGRFGRKPACLHLGACRGGELVPRSVRCQGPATAAATGQGRREAASDAPGWAARTARASEEKKTVQAHPARNLSSLLTYVCAGVSRRLSWVTRG